MPTDDLDRDKMYTAGAGRWIPTPSWNSNHPTRRCSAAEERRAAEAIEGPSQRRSTSTKFTATSTPTATAKSSKSGLDRLAQFSLPISDQAPADSDGRRRDAADAARQWIGLGTVFIVGIMLAVAGVSLYLKLEENKRQEEADRRRQQDVRRAAGRSKAPDRSAGSMPRNSRKNRRSNLPAANAHRPRRRRASFRFQFSMSQLLVAITVAALLLGLCIRPATDRAIRRRSRRRRLSRR